MTLALFCSQPFSPREVEHDFALEQAAAKDAGFTTALVDHDAIVRGDLADALGRIPSYAGSAVYRGFMMRASAYRALHEALTDRGITLVNDVALRTDGSWTVIEVGDGQVTGLPDVALRDGFYTRLYEGLVSRTAGSSGARHGIEEAVNRRRCDMGAWGELAFDNDTANDWAYDLEGLDDLSLVEAAFDELEEVGSDYLDQDVACPALAACEVIARLRGHAGYNNAYTEKVDEWVATNRIVPHQALIERAVAAIDRILGAKSELRELWEEGDATTWHAAVANLRHRVLA